MSRNYSLYTIPAYFTLTMVPHLYSTVLVQKSTTWDNANPRGKKFDESLRKSLPPTCFLQYERCRAAHGNMHDNMALFVGAVLAGNMAGLDAEYLNRMMAYYLFSRILYLVLYIKIEKLKYSGMRTVSFLVGIAFLFSVYFKAASALVSKGV